MTSQLVAGCTLIDPFVTWDPLEEPKQQTELTLEDVNRLESEPKKDGPLSRAFAKIDLRTRNNVSIDQAMAYADRGKTAYNTALSEHAEVQSLMGIALIPLTAAAIGLGATGASENLIIALGLGGAATYGTGTWLLNKPRQAGYVAGLKALTCAQQVIEPFDFPLIDHVIFETQLEKLNNGMVTVGQRLAEVEGSIARVDRQAVLAKTSGSELLKIYADNAVLMVTASKAQVGAVASVLTSAEEAHLNGIKLQREIESAGRKLANSVNKIAAELSEIINETQKDPQALATIIQGLGQSYATFTTVPVVLRPAVEPATAGEGITPQSAEDAAAEIQKPAHKVILKNLLSSMEQLTVELVLLGKDVARLSGARREVAVFVNKVVPTATFESCGISKESLIADLTINPAGPFTLPSGKRGSVGFTVKGGQSPYGASLGGGQVDGLSVTQPAPFSPVVTVTSEDSVAPGKFVVNVVDGSGRTAVVPFEIVGAAEPEKPSTKDKGGKFKALSGELPGEKLSEVKGVTFFIETAEPSDDGTKLVVTLGKPEGTPTGDISKEDLRNAVVAILPSGSQVGAAEIEIGNYDELMASLQSGDPPVAADLVFTAQSEDDRKKIQTALCLADDQVDGVWGPITKEALEAFQDSEGETPDGVLTEGVKDQLLALTPDAIAARCTTE